MGPTGECIAIAKDAVSKLEHTKETEVARPASELFRIGCGRGDANDSGGAAGVDSGNLSERGERSAADV